MWPSITNFRWSLLYHTQNLNLRRQRRNVTLNYLLNSLQHDAWLITYLFYSQSRFPKKIYHKMPPLLFIKFFQILQPLFLKQHSNNDDPPEYLRLINWGWQPWSLWYWDLSRISSRLRTHTTAEDVALKTSEITTNHAKRGKAIYDRFLTIHEGLESEDYK